MMENGSFPPPQGSKMFLGNHTADYPLHLGGRSQVTPAIPRKARICYLWLLSWSENFSNKEKEMEMTEQATSNAFMIVLKKNLIGLW
jgi:hypothetical protein